MKKVLSFVLMVVFTLQASTLATFALGVDGVVNNKDGSTSTFVSSENAASFVKKLKSEIDECWLQQHECSKIPWWKKIFSSKCFSDNYMNDRCSHIEQRNTLITKNLIPQKKEALTYGFEIVEIPKGNNHIELLVCSQKYFYDPLSWPYAQYLQANYIFSR